MNCIKCKEPLPNNKLFCPNCGFLNEVSNIEEQNVKEDNFIFKNFSTFCSTYNIKIILLFSLPLIALSILELYRLLTSLLQYESIKLEYDYFVNVEKRDSSGYYLQFAQQIIIYILAFFSFLVAIRTFIIKKISGIQKLNLFLIPVVYFSFLIWRVILWYEYYSNYKEGVSEYRVETISQMIESSLIGYYGTFHWGGKMPELLVTIIFSSLIVFWFRQKKLTQNT